MSRSIGDNGTTDLMNLLHTDSDSDAVELLNLPPLKKANNKPKKRRRSRVNSQELCSLWNLLKVVMVLTLIGVVAMTGAVTYRLTNQVKDLQNKIKKLEVESSSQDLPSQWQGIKSQVQEFNKSLMSFQTGDKGLNNVINNLTLISAQVKALQTALNVTKAGVNKNPSPANTDISSLKQSMATMLSKVESLKTSHTEFEKKSDDQFKKLTEKIQQLEEKSSLMTIGVNPSSPPAILTLQEKAEFKQQLDELNQSVEASNISVSSKLDQIEQDLAAHQSHFDALDSAATTPHLLNTSAVTETVKGQLIPYIQALVKNSSHSIPTTSDSIALDAIKSQVKNITTSVLDLQQQISANPGGDMPENELTALKAIQTHLTTTESKLESMDASIKGLQNETAVMMSLYVQEKNSIMNLTHIVDGVQRYINIMHKSDKGQKVPPSPEIGSHDTETSTPYIDISTPGTDTNTPGTDTNTAPVSTPTDDKVKTTKRAKRGTEVDLNMELEDIFE